MALSAAEEALVRELIAENPQLLSLADNEATIISKLGATKKNLSELAAALSLNDTDLAFVRQGSSDKSVALSVLKAFAVAGVPAASETVSGIAELATTAEATAGTDDLRIMTPLKTKQAITAFAPPLVIASTAEAQALTNNTNFITPLRLKEAMQGANMSLSANGYQKLPSGLIIQWGKASTTINASGGTATVSLPVTFPAAGLSVVGNLDSASTIAGGFPVNTNIFSTSQIKLTLDAAAGVEPTSGTYSINWIAIGH